MTFHVICAILLYVRIITLYNYIHMMCEVIILYNYIHMMCEVIILYRYVQIITGC